MENNWVFVINFKGFNSNPYYLYVNSDDYNYSEAEDKLNKMIEYSDAVKVIQKIIDRL